MAKKDQNESKRVRTLGSPLLAFSYSSPKSDTQRVNISVRWRASDAPWREIAEELGQQYKSDPCHPRCGLLWAMSEILDFFVNPLLDLNRACG